MPALGLLGEAEATDDPAVESGTDPPVSRAGPLPDSVAGVAGSPAVGLAAPTEAGAAEPTVEDLLSRLRSTTTIVTKIIVMPTNAVIRLVKRFSDFRSIQRIPLVPLAEPMVGSGASPGLASLTRAEGGRRDSRNAEKLPGSEKADERTTREAPLCLLD
jgi:hypothetical protein